MAEDLAARIKKKWVPVYVVLLAATIVLLAGLYYLYMLTGSSDYSTAGLLDAAAVAYIAWSLYKLVGLKFKPREVVTLVECGKCGYREERPYEPGDYFFKEKGKCPKCGGPLYIAGVYVKEEGEEASFKPLPLSSSLATFITAASRMKRR